jgi:hypothetical protein
VFFLPHPPHLPHLPQLPISPSLQKRGRESDISRVLFSLLSYSQEGGYLSGTFVTKCLKRYISYGTGKRPTIVPLTLLPTGVYRASASRRCWCALTAPLHPYRYRVNSKKYSFDVCLCSGGMFLWHSPHGCPHWALPSKFGLSEARTFLKPASLPICNPLAGSLPMFTLDDSPIEFNGEWLMANR